MLVVQHSFARLGFGGQHCVEKRRLACKRFEVSAEGVALCYIRASKGVAAARQATQPLALALTVCLTAE